MKVHITGGCGYVGSRVAVRLSKAGHQIVVIDKATPQERGRVFTPDIEFRQANLVYPEQARKSLEDAETVIHLAANIGSMNYMYEHQGEILWENSAIDAAVYPVFRDVGVKLLMYSSTSMVFQHAPRYPYTESDLANTPAPTNVYGFSKLSGEYYCKAFKQQYDAFDYIIVRFHNIYGPGEDSKGSTPGDIHVIPALIEKVLRGQYPLEFIGGADATRTFTYIDDAVDAVVKLFQKGAQGDKEVLNTDFNLSTPEVHKIIELGERIWKLLGDGRPFKYVVTDSESASHTALRREADVRKLMSVIDWKPSLSLDEGILKTADWVKEVIAAKAGASK